MASRDDTAKDETAVQPSTRSSSWAPLGQPAFRAIWIAGFFSSIGSWMHDAGAGWMMTTLAPSAAMVAGVQAATTLPVFLLSLPAGALADIVDRRRFLIFSQSWLMMATGLLGVLTFFDLVTAWSLLAVTFAIGIGLAMSLPAFSAIIPDLVPRRDLAAAVTLNGIAMNGSRAIGPALAGLIVAWSGPATVFLLNSFSFVGLLIVLVRWRARPNRSPLPGERLTGAIRLGLRFARQDRALQAAIIRGASFFCFASAPIALLPLVARNELSGGATTYGILLASFGAGAVSSAFFLPALRARLSPDRMIFVGSLAHAATILGLAHLHTLFTLCPTLFIAGAAWISVMSSVQVAAQLALPAWVRARGLSVVMMAIMGVIALTSTLWGQLADRTSLTVSLTVAALGAVVGLLLAARAKLGSGQHDLTTPQTIIDPNVALPIADNRGPVMVQWSYAIRPQDRQAFADLMRDVRRMRLRNGAIAWGLFHDAAEPTRYIETVIVESWLEYLRQQQRITVADQALQERAFAFNAGEGPPAVAHFIAEPLTKRSRRERRGAP